jgi:hypothetical protein
MATLVIGIGSSGLDILEKAQEFNYEFLGKNNPDNEDITYLSLDTQRDRRPKRTTFGQSSIKHEEIGLTDITAKYDELVVNEYTSTNWFPSRNQLKNQDAASGVPTYGRLALWVNFDKVDQYLEDLRQRGEGRNARVFIVGSLTGGTGSGICVDLPYMIRKKVGEDATIHANFMIPSIQEETDQYFLNSYLALKSIEYYASENTNYSISFPDGQRYESPTSPYNQVSVISPDYDSNAPVRNPEMGLQELFDLVGLYTSLLFLSNRGQQMDFFTKLEERRTDARERSQMGKFSTWGLALAQYPKQKIQEYLALNYAREEIRKWRDGSPENEIGGIRGQAERDIRGVINNSVSNYLNIPIDGTNLSDYAEIWANNIKNNNLEGKRDLDEYLNSKLAQSSANYDSVAGAIDNAKDRIIEEINENVSQYPGKYLPFYLEYIKSIASQLNPENQESILHYWRNSLGISPEAQNWPTLFAEEREKLKQQLSSAKLIGQKESLIKEKVEDILSLLKMSFLYDLLKNVGNSIVNNEKLISNTGRRLVTLSDLEGFKAKLNAIERSENTGKSLIDARKEAISGDPQNRGQIFNYFDQGDNFEQEVNSLKKIIDGQGQNPAEGLITNGQGVLALLKNENEQRIPTPKKPEDVYKDIVPKIIENIRIPTNNYLGDTKVYNMISKSTTNDTFKQNLYSHGNEYLPPAFARLSGKYPENSTFKNAFNCRFCSDSAEELTKLRNDLREENGFDRDVDDRDGSDNFFQIPALINSIVAFKEYCLLNQQEDDVKKATLIPTRDLYALYWAEEHLISPRLDNGKGNFDSLLDSMPYLKQLENSEKRKSILKNDTIYQ